MPAGGAQVVIKGVRDSGTFSTKAEAAAWAAKRETEIREDKATGVQRGKTVDDAFRRYEKEVSSHKRGSHWEAVRLNAIGCTEVGGTALKDRMLAAVTPELLGQWRDRRLNLDKVTGSTVNRELNLLSHVFATAAKEWKWIAQSPTADVRRPKESPPRDKLYTDDEIARICLALGFDLGGLESVESVSQRVAVAFLFAIETAMRAGEICGLMPPDVVGRVATLKQTKNGLRRNVPLSTRAMQLLELLPLPAGGETVFGVSTKSVDALSGKPKSAQ